MPLVTRFIAFPLGVGSSGVPRLAGGCVNAMQTSGKSAKRLALAASLAAACAALVAGSASSGAAAVARPSITFGVATGEVSATSALVWARADGPARAYVEVAANGRFAR